MDDNPALHANTRVGKDEWLRGAIDLIAEEGVGGLKVEPLARRLGITKGSFYWHFDDRADLIAQALDLWLQLATLDVIERLRPIADPEACLLRALFTESSATGRRSDRCAPAGPGGRSDPSAR